MRVRGDLVVIKEKECKGGSIQRLNRPCVIVSNNTGNKFSSIYIVCPVTSKPKKWLPTHVSISGFGLSSEHNVVLCEQIMTVNQTDVLDASLGRIGSKEMEEIDRALLVSLSLKGAKTC